MNRKLREIGLFRSILTLLVAGTPFFLSVVSFLSTGKFSIVYCVISAIPVIYWAPTIYALITNTPNFFIIFGMNLLFAWTGLGWVICFMTVILDLRNNVIRVPSATVLRSRKSVPAL